MRSGQNTAADTKLQALRPWEVAKTRQQTLNSKHLDHELAHDIPQLRQLEPLLEQMAMACMGGILDRLFLHATRPGWNPGGAAAKGRWLSRIPRAWESWWLQVWGWHICLNWTFSVTQSKGHSGLATFYGTGLGAIETPYRWEKYTGGGGGGGGGFDTWPID